MMQNGNPRPNGHDGLHKSNGAFEKQYTGASLVLLREAGADRKLQRNFGLKVAHSSDFAGSCVDFNELGERDALILDEIEVAVIPGAPDQTRSLQVLSEGTDEHVLAVEPEQMMRALVSPYWQGYRDGVNSAVERIVNGLTVEDLELEVAFLDESRSAWGLQATNVAQSRFSGKNVRIAILDTGIDLNHPDFRGRAIRSQSFVAGETVQDGHGHGTHCIGTACGSNAPRLLPRYGCAFQSEIFAGKVLSNAGSGPDRSVLAGINWAIANVCRIVSLSLGSPAGIGERPSAVYEQVAQRALARGVLLVGAAGNESSRPGRINAVGRPANCPSILSVGAVDRHFRVAPFSNGGLNRSGGAVDIAGPGMDVYSSVPMRRRYARLNGASMAAAHVAGIAAMHSEATGLTGNDLRSRLMHTARKLDLPSTDVGAGLVQAP